MRVVAQRVREASVAIDGAAVGRIGHGMMVLVGVTDSDTAEDADFLVSKLAHLRIFDDGNGVMNLDISAVGGDFLIVSQFTLYASTKKGNRPSYIRSAREPISRPLYEYFVRRMESETGRRVATGVFGADMQVSLINDGPVTICMDSKNRE